MKLTETGCFRFIFLALFLSLNLISGSFGFQKASIPGNQKNQIPSFSLIGVIVSENTSSSIAVLQNSETGKTVILSIGESVLNLELTHVLDDGIILKKGEEIYWILFEQNLQVKTDENIRMNPKAVKRIDQVNVRPKEREYVRSEIQKRIERERPLLLKETSVVPNYVDGNISGFKVTGLPKESIASEIGIQKDDVIKEINGIKLNDLSALVQLYNRIMDVDRYEVLIERNKELIRQVYVLK